MHTPTQERRVALRALIESFLAERLTAKLEKIDKESAKNAEDTETVAKREAELARHQYGTWIEDAARRSAQIQVVTHTIKAVHSAAKGSSLYTPPSSLPDHALVGTHSLGDGFAGDVVGNAAALDVYKFLKLEHEGKSLLDLMLSNDTDLVAALNEDPAIAQVWIACFTGITRPNGDLATHTRAKQVYWLAGEDPLNDAEYHLLTPLYGSSLAHHVYQTLQNDRFGDQVKEARQARREKRFHETTINDYPHLAVQKLGGTKPQNISQLNSERRGENYLLASLPPIWKSQQVRLPIRTATGSAFQGFARREEVKTLVGILRRFLSDDPEPNMHTRNTRDRLVSRLIDELLIYAAEMQACPPGWSLDPNCNLKCAEQLWLDPRRTAQDENFAAEWKRMEWVQEIRRTFGNWLNEQLRQQLSVGDTEHRQWSRDLGSDALWLDAIALDKQWLEQFERDQQGLCEDTFDE